MAKRKYKKRIKSKEVSNMENLAQYRFLKGNLQINNTVYTDIHLENENTVNTLRKILGDNFDNLIKRV